MNRKPMSHSAFQDRMNDWVDGLLDPSEAAAMAAHRDACAPCAAAHEALQDIVARARELPDSVEPARDLWPHLEARLAASPQAQGADPRRRGWLPRMAWGGLAAAAGVAVVAAATVLVLTNRLGPQPEPAPVAAAFPARPSSLEAVVFALEAECRGAGIQLLASVRGHDGGLGEAASASFTESLAVLDRAIEETRNALVDDPENRRLQAMLAERYQRKLNLLQEALRLSMHA